jgi:Ca-activated chloride channel homolog
MFWLGNYKYLLYSALITGIVLILFLFYAIWKERAIAGLARGAMREYLVKRSMPITRLKQALVAICIVLFGLTVLRPQWGEQVRQATSEGTDLLIALDVSPSMRARDVKPDRLTRAKDAVRWIVESLKGDRVGLILFSGDAFLQCPLTNDYGAFMMFLDSASPESIALKGTNIGAALKEAYRVFKNKRLTSRILVLITDGEDHEGATEEAASLLKELDVSVYTAGIGSSSGEEIPMAGDNASGGYYRDDAGMLIKSRKHASFLKRIAGYTGGTYVDITDGFSGLRGLLGVIEDQQKNKYGTRIIKEPKEQYQIFALIIFILLSVDLLLSERRLLRGERTKPERRKRLSLRRVAKN